MFRMERRIAAEREHEKAEARRKLLSENLDLDDVLSWDEKMVKEFLRTKELSMMTPIFSNTNGQELMLLFSMCEVNSTSMYRSLQIELLRNYNRMLPISVYLRFICSLRSLCDRSGTILKAQNKSESINDTYSVD